MKLNNFLTAVFATLLTCSLASAGGYKHKKKDCPGNGTASECRDEGSIDVFGEVPICLDLLVVDTNADIDFENLGKTAINDVKVGEFSVDSNAAEGFSLSFSSAENGDLVKVGAASASSTNSVSYLVDLDRTGGVLGAGTVEPAGLSGISLASDAQLDFAGTDVEPTVGLTYDVRLSVEANTSLEAGIYSDTITINLAAL